MAVHELGHVLAAWASGGAVSRVLLHPLRVSWTSLSYNPHPQLVAWGGPALGALLPWMLSALAGCGRIAMHYLFRFFAGFCLVANGLYLLVDAFGRDGDGGTLIRNGAPVWSLFIFGVLTIPAGFRLWHGLGPHFGLGHAQGRVTKAAALTSLGLLGGTVAAELLFGWLTNH